jgi:hypothetical protein
MGNKHNHQVTAARVEKNHRPKTATEPPTPLLLPPIPASAAASFSHLLSSRFSVQLRSSSRRRAIQSASTPSPAATTSTSAWTAAPSSSADGTLTLCPATARSDSRRHSRT